jgi:HEAT repeat protein
MLTGILAFALSIPSVTVVTHASVASCCPPTSPASANQTRPQAETRDNVTPAEVKAAVDQLGSIDFPVRTGAARTVRRAAPAVAVPILTDAVSRHADQYVRFKALVVLSGFNHPGTADVMRRAMTDKNDRLRAVAYEWFEHHPDPAVLPLLLAALSREDSEFVRPSLTRALAAHGSNPKVRAQITALVMKGQDFFRAGVIEAAGEYRAVYALPQIMSVAKLDGPLQDDAVVAIGRIGDTKGLETLVGLQRTAPRNIQPSVAAAICLLGVNCSSHQGYLVETLGFAIGNPGFQELLRATAHGLAALAIAGREEALAVLFERGAPTRDPERAAIALAIGTVALRNTPLLLKVLEPREDAAAWIELLREAFDMFEEDFEEERFFAAVRRAYWQAPEGSPPRRVAGSLIQRLEF